MAIKVSIPVYAYDLTDYLTSQESEQMSFKPRDGDVAMGHGDLDGREIGIAMSWTETQLIGDIIAPEGSRVLQSDCYGPCLYIDPDCRLCLTVEEALSCAREGELGLSWKPLRRQATAARGALNGR